jgi:anaerobic carbon-monoxide dehydrogenase iron sulfur subunit
VKRLVVSEALCSGCRACETACVAAHDGHFGLATARIRVIKIEADGVDRPRVCQFCSPAPCAAACPTGALSWDKSLGAVLLYPGDCIACSACADACDHGMVFIRPLTGLPLICDLCNGSPACAKRCATGALRYQDHDTERGPREAQASLGAPVAR